MYDQVIAHIKDHVVTGADTQLLLAVDHDFGGLTLSSKWNQRPIAAASCTSEHLVSLLGQCKGDGHKGYLATELLRHYGLFNATDDLLDTYKRSGSTPRVVTMGQALAAKAGIHWSTTSHISDDVDLYGTGWRQSLQHGAGRAGDRGAEREHGQQDGTAEVRGRRAAECAGGAGGG
ncbi:alkaline phosphatase [Beauveria bassiana ARSEF 2860]|uniref:Alkaline phosphatase n=1 Tax=Beauveria bassiana (strain ARSEF 2860) TaxID=655819 RepID=J4UN31_BEAB2|nr:alkaline phosphatase [Beauveria bassiana ARSEF 2860]EJP66402.1 alkaline phosphatase [Beauveria bassiana ARSEF 2860]